MCFYVETDQFLNSDLLTEILEDFIPLSELCIFPIQEKNIQLMGLLLFLAKIYVQIPRLPVGLYVLLQLFSVLFIVECTIFIKKVCS